VLDAIGGALRLTEPERAYLYLLAGFNPPRAGGARGAAVSPELRRLLDAAIVINASWTLHRGLPRRLPLRGNQSRCTTSRPN
jgi:hypothetical protein